MTDILTDEQIAAMTADERLRYVIESAKASEHPYLHAGDIVTVGKRDTRYEIEVAMKAIVVLKATESGRRRRLIDEADIARINVIEASPETQKMIDAAAAKRRDESATQWATRHIAGIRNDRKRMKARFDEYVAKARFDDEYVVSTLVDYQIANDIVENIDEQLRMNAEDEIVEPIWETIITTASYQLQYGRGSINSSEPVHRARAQSLQAEWTKLLATAISIKAHAEGDQRRRRY